MTQYRLPEELDKLTLQQASTTKIVLENELDALDTVISEAEHKRRGEFYMDAYQRQRGYEELYRHGFSKTVVIDTELKGRLNYRISQATSDYANTKLGFSTPNTPIGNLCRVARLGMTHESAEWGEYTIVEIRNFARYTGQEAAEQIRNFRVMESQSLILSEKKANFESIVTNLRSVLGRWFAKKDNSQEEALLSNSELLSIETVDPEILAGVGIELDFDFDEPVLLIDNDVEQENHYDIFGRSEKEQDDYYGLSNYFFMNPTEEQLAIMTNTVYAGPMLVEGVAGSGKTCAALGRAKTLFDLARSTDDAQYNSDFLAESSVGFVRTGELVQYLRASCLELDISQLPIEEYAKLVYDLSHFRNLFIEQGKVASELTSDVSDSENDANDDTMDEGLGAASTKAKTKYNNLGTIPNYDFQHETRMSWLRAICSVIGLRIADDLQRQLDSLSIPDNVANDKFVAKPENAKALLNIVKTRLTALYQPVMLQLREQSSAPFAIDQVINHIYQAQTQLENELFSKHAKWVNPAAGEWIQTRDAKSSIELLRKSGAAFVVYEKLQNKVIMAEVMVEMKEDLLNLFSQGAQISSKANMKLWSVNESESAWQQLQSGTQPFYCQFVNDQPVSIRFAKDFDDLNIRLIRNQLLARINKRVFPIIDANPFCRQIDAGQKPTSLEKLFKIQLRRVYRKWQFADLYRDALLQSSTDDENKAATERLKEQKLAEHDKDLLLALAHIMTRGVGQEASVPSHLLEQRYYRSVFIDEVQDFTEQQIFLMAEQATPKYHAVTLVGDMHQQLHRGNVKDINACFPYRPLNQYLLKQNKRQERQPQLAATAMLFRAVAQKDSRLHESGFIERWQEQAKTGESKQFYENLFSEVDNQLLEIINEQPHGRTIAVICPTQELAIELENRIHVELSSKTSRSSHVSNRIDLAKKYVVHFSCPDHVKGLEFDVIIYAGMEHIDWNDAHQLNKTYVTLSRPRKQLVMFGQASKLPHHVQTCLLPEANGGSY